MGGNNDVIIALSVRRYVSVTYFLNPNAVLF